MMADSQVIEISDESSGTVDTKACTCKEGEARKLQEEKEKAIGYKSRRITLKNIFSSESEPTPEDNTEGMIKIFLFLLC